MFALFWTWHHRAPADLIGERMLSLALSDDARERRRRALLRHRSQFSDEHGRPQLDEGLVQCIDWPSEYFLAATPMTGSASRRSGAGLLTGVPPVTSNPSAVET